MEGLLLCDKLAHNLALNTAPKQEGTAVAKISEPGIYPMSNAEYHGEPTDGPCLGSTGARLLANSCPAIYRWRTDHPETKDAFDIGSATHLLVLEPEQFQAGIGVIQQDDYKTKAAQAARDDIRATGRIPLNQLQYEDVISMRNALLRDPIAQNIFGNHHHAELSFFWRHETYRFWSKCRPDLLPRGARPNYLIDLKTSTSADPDEFARAVANLGYHQQAAWYLDGIAAVTGHRPQRFAFVVVQKTAPYLVTTFWLDDEALAWGATLNEYARGAFAWCLEKNQWPSFTPDIAAPPAAFTISLPKWTLRQLEERQERGALIPPQQRV